MTSCFRCDECGQTGEVRGDLPRRSVTGRTMCAACSDRLLGLAAGVLVAEQQGAGLGGTVANGIATQGWFLRVKDAVRRRR